MYYVEYIQTDQNCWFDTGIIPDINTKVELDITTPSSVSSDWRGFFGAQNADDSPSTFQIRRYNRNNQFSARVGDGIGADSGPNYTTNTRYTLTLDKDYFVVNETQYSVGATSFDTCNYNLFINGINNPSWANQYRAACGTYHRIKIWENGVLVGDFRPAVDDNDNVGFYDDVTHTFKQNLGTGTPVAGPIASSINVTPSKTTLKATGETISIEVATENAWTLSTSGDSFLTLSSTGDTGSTTITATAPSYTGATARTDVLTFTDSVTGDEAVLTIKQKKYQSGQPLYLGANEVGEIYLGDYSINEAYLGEELVFSSGPFQGLKIIPKSISFNSGALTRSCKVKSSEPWSMTIPSWVTASTLTGNSGETIVSLSTTAQTAATSGSIVVTTANYSASASCDYYDYQLVNYIHSQTMGRSANKFIDTLIYPTTATSCQLKGQFKGYETGNALVGTYTDVNFPDSQDFRIFPLHIYEWYMDVAAGRLSRNIGVQTANEDFDISFGNLFMENNITGDRYTGATQQSQIAHLPILVDIGIVWFAELKIWEGATLVFDGKAAKVGDDYGIYDSVGGNFLTSNDFTIVGEE